MIVYSLPVWLVVAGVAVITLLTVVGAMALVYLATRTPFPEVDDFTKRRMILAPRFDRPIPLPTRPDPSLSERHGARGPKDAA